MILQKQTKQRETNIETLEKQNIVTMNKILL